MTYNTSTSSIKHTKEEEGEGRREKNQCQHNEDGDLRLIGREKENIFTSFGLFFAVATPVKPTKKEKKVTEELFTDNFHKESDFFFF